MILSVSRRTDVPNYYSEWFYNRIKAGFAYVRNPINTHGISRIDLSPKLVDCIVFWTKNPAPMLDRLDELSSYKYYFQFTLTGYGKDIEPNLPDKKAEIIPTFKKLSEKIGADRVILRYDPIMFTKTYTPEYHLKAFEQITAELKGYTKKCVISFADIYAKNRKNMREAAVCEISRSALLDFSKNMSGIAKANDMITASCAEEIDLSGCKIAHNCCIDKELIENITGYRIEAAKDRNQRAACGCIESIDIGAYNTCKNGCKYCYANYSPESVIKNCKCYDEKFPLLCSEVSAQDKVTARAVKSLREQQLSMFD